LCKTEQNITHETTRKQHKNTQKPENSTKTREKSEITYNDGTSLRQRRAAAAQGDRSGFSRLTNHTKHNTQSKQKCKNDIKHNKRNKNNARIKSTNKKNKAK
jgi:hypothetical protein